ncbi:ABC transporter permease [Maricaulis parjimensis]|uniref:ABC transporter permease n=1 Tax=Maricaulis parjimensis TaxID=144023 RepID=UPI00193A694B|nr:ABC transporter permease [Maricaulis parjimensis]
MRNIYLIARREFLSYVATWGFWLSLLSVPMFMALGFGMPILIESSQPTRYYVLVDETGGRLEQAVYDQMDATRAEQAEELERVREMAGDLLGDNPQVQATLESSMQLSDDDYIRVSPAETSLDALRPYLTGNAQLETSDGPQDLFAAIYLSEPSPGQIEIDYWSANLTDSGLRSTIRNALRDYMQLEHLVGAGVDPALIAEADDLRPTVRELNPQRSAETAEVSETERLPIFVGVATAFGLWVVIFSVVNMLLTAMIEEKGNKVLEMMLASARHHEILVGKLLGVAAVSFTLLLFWGGLASTGGFAIQQIMASADIPAADIMATLFSPALIGPAIGYFIIGYLMYGAIFLAVGSLCETIQDAQSLMSPIMLVMMVPLFLVMMAIDAPDSPIVAVASWVPLWTPFIMLVRLPQDIGLIEILGTTLGMIAMASLVIWGAGQLFRMGALNQANQDTVKGWFKIGKTKSIG